VAVRIRKAEFTGQEDKFYAPADDIRNCYLPIVKGALEAAYAERPDLREGLCGAAKALAAFYKRAFLAEATVPELLGEVYGTLAHEGPEVLAVVADAVMRGMLAYYATAQREVVNDRDLTQREVERIAAVGALFAKMRPMAREELEDVLQRAGQYPPELARPPQEGAVEEFKKEV